MTSPAPYDPAPQDAATADFACTADGVDPDDFFPDPDDDVAVQAALRICAGCPARDDCWAQAVAGGEEHGIWGGRRETELQSQTVAAPRQQRRAAALTHAAGFDLRQVTADHDLIGRSSTDGLWLLRTAQTTAAEARAARERESFLSAARNLGLPATTLDRRRYRVRGAALPHPATGVS